MNGALIENPVISVESLAVDYWDRKSWVNVVDAISFEIQPGEVLGLAGESGCGKSTTAYALLGYRRRGSRFRQGSVFFEGTDLLKLSEKEMTTIRGSRIGFVPQNAGTALNPSMRLGSQVVESLVMHKTCSSQRQARQRAMELLAAVGLPDPAIIFNRFPHQVSGGQQQRVVIAIALACYPRLLILDEPTTGLDVTTQARIVELLLDIRAEYGISMLYVTHDLGVLAQICDRLAVMYAGSLVEVAPSRIGFRSPCHSYTRGLMAAVPRVSRPNEGRRSMRGMLRRDDLPDGCKFSPRCDGAQARCSTSMPPLEMVAPDHWVRCWQRASELPHRSESERANGDGQNEVRQVISQHNSGAVQCPGARTQPDTPAGRQTPLLEVRNLSCSYGSAGFLASLLNRHPVSVVHDVSLSIEAEETLALVGESGSGKSTIVRAIAGLLASVSGQIFFEGEAVPTDVRRRSSQLCREIQLVLQNPDASLNPRHKASYIVGRPLEQFFGITGRKQRERVEELLRDVRLDAGYADRYPSQLSGGERQRIATARALAAGPKLLLCDEVLSALDVSVQASVLDLLRRLQEEHRVAYLFVSHDLATVRWIADRVGVLYQGKLCEVGDSAQVFAPPRHPYTQMLLLAVPEPDPDQALSSRQRSNSETSLMLKSQGCPFAPRCQRRIGEVCDTTEPTWREVTQGHRILCHLAPNDLMECPR